MLIDPAAREVNRAALDAVVGHAVLVARCVGATTVQLDLFPVRQFHIDQPLQQVEVLLLRRRLLSLKCSVRANQRPGEMPSTAFNLVMVLSFPLSYGLRPLTAHTR